MPDTAPAPRSPLEFVRWISWAQMKAGEDWTRERELTRSQSFVLDSLVQSPGASQSELARRSRTTPASVSSLLRGLEGRGLIERRTEGGDERTKRVYATAAGAALIAGFEEAMVAADETILAPLDADERAAFQKLLAKITAQLPQPVRD
ncbi:MarR family winged helix-turn-helix transcriptional regulator [Pseudoclavibacter terrae]|uniref:MarR family winged helix-turn-helix transcriptional regulator n=1 Tax=Pseudoclavibacter terrae TaxID=1530195 RepID=UPI00232E5BE7|nr:MarR family transcriptional regulator [Pseudoclavibacter terrae]